MPSVLAPLMQRVLEQPVANRSGASAPVRGAEMIGNGDFTDGATGWTVVGEDATHIMTFGGGTCRYQSDTVSPVLILQRSGVVFTPGRSYEIVIVVSSYVSGSLQSDRFSGNLVTGAGVNRSIKPCVGTGIFNLYRSSTNVDVTIDSISVRPVVQ